MTTNKKSNLLPIILISTIIIFIASIYWKIVNKSNAEVINIIAPVETVNEKKNKPKDLSFLDDDIEVIADSSSFQTLPKLSKEEYEKITNSKLNIGIMYNTPEKIMKAIVTYQELDNDEKVDELIAFMLEYYPDFEFPDDF